MLQNCPDCGKEFSTLAKTCPNCGRPNQTYLEMHRDWKNRKSQRTLADCEVYESLFQMKLGLFLLAGTIGLTFLLMQIGFAPATMESQSFTEFLGNPQDWIRFYTSFFIVFYLAICIWISGGIVSGFLSFFLLFAAAAYIGSLLPGFLSGIMGIVFVLFPFWLLFVRPVRMLIRAGYFRRKAEQNAETDTDRFLEQVDAMNRTSGLD